MSLAESFLPEFDYEMSLTRKTLERTPQDRLAWAPHPKSFTWHALASHVANTPGWTAQIMNSDGMDLAAPPPPRTLPENASEILAEFDRNVAAARERLAAASDGEMQAPWTLRHGAETIFTLPRRVVLNNWIVKHLIHHRAQLGMYLRLNDLPVPSIYGPSADEGKM